MMHEVFNRMFENRLIFPAMPQLRRVLECGFGCGAWAVEVAEQYPNCEVREATPSASSSPGLMPPHLEEGRPETLRMLSGLDFQPSPGLPNCATG